jgi:hypothetical protein
MPKSSLTTPADTLETLYDHPTSHPLFDAWESNGPRLADKFGLSSAQLAEERDSFTAAARDADLPWPQARKLNTLWVDHRLRSDDGVYQAQVARWPEATRRHLRERFGGESERLQGKVTRFLSQHPGLAGIVGAGLVWQTEVHNMLIERVERES